MQIDRPIAIAITLFVILLVVFFLVVPEYRTFKNLQTDLGIKRAEYRAEFDYYVEIAKTYAELKVREDEVKKIDDALPVALPAANDPTLAKVLYFLNETAKENGLIIKENKFLLVWDFSQF